MVILSLYLRNFRNYEEAFIPFSPGVNLITGENGEGKTNLLEALYLFVTGRSFRTSRLADLVQWQKPHFYLELRFLKHNVEQSLKIYADGEQRKILHNYTPISQLSALFGILIGVILSPADFELIAGHPARRRQFLDLHIAQTNPSYLFHLSRYMRALKQRNCLLKAKECSMIDVWEEEMATSAAFLVLTRKKIVEEINAHASPFQAFLSQKKDALSLHYRTACSFFSLEEAAGYYKEQYQKLRVRELECGYTLSGPHKDDLSILLGDRDAKFFGSEGQLRSTALSLRLAEWERFHNEREEKPLFFLDDVGMGLDTEREKALYSFIPKLGQVFLTSPRLAHSFPLHVIRIKGGKVEVKPELASVQ
jgi:DNA replication and repair protein RecF